jgi:hypothetical protein
VSSNCVTKDKQALLKDLWTNRNLRTRLEQHQSSGTHSARIFSTEGFCSTKESLHSMRSRRRSNAASDSVGHAAGSGRSVPEGICRMEW